MKTFILLVSLLTLVACHHDDDNNTTTIVQPISENTPILEDPIGYGEIVLYCRPSFSDYYCVTVCNFNIPIIPDETNPLIPAGSYTPRIYGGETWQHTIRAGVYNIQTVKRFYPDCSGDWSEDAYSDETTFEGVVITDGETTYWDL